MKKPLLIVIAVLLVAALVVAAVLLIPKWTGKDSADTAADEKMFVTIGTGGITGVYYPTGGAISRIVNQQEDKVADVRVTVESTGGSAFNVNAILSGDMQFGVVQSDRQYQGYNGLAEWEGSPQEKLRAAFSLHPESVTLIAAEDSGIATMEDLAGKVISIGNHGSGFRQNAIDALAAYGIDYTTDITAQDLAAVEAAGALQDGKIDAFFYTVGHPNGSIEEATSGTRKTLFVAITEVDELIAQHPYYAKSEIPVANYPGSLSKTDVPTFGVLATILTSADVSADVVYTVVKAVFENLDEFKALHPAFANLTAEDMVSKGISIPFHEGAIRYFEEAGLDYTKN